METIHRKTQVPMGIRCQERPEEDETHKMDRTSPRSAQMERNCWEGQDSTRVVAPSKKKKKKEEEEEEEEEKKEKKEEEESNNNNIIVV